MKIYDVSVQLSADLPTYPGDPKISFEQSSSISKGDPANVTRIDMGSHTGTHIDAPYHFIDDGPKLDQLKLEIMMGRTHVLQVTAPVINESVLEEFDFTDKTRVLFKTRNSYLWDRGPEFVKDYVYIEPSAAELLVREGIKLVGIDYLSVEKFGSTKFETHLEFLRNDIVILEGLNLKEVEPGDYDMVCLPMRLASGDGAPARVILRK
ncbi:MAG TPA: cyclase family protein [Blastocatellia bacterium]|nr:cyclase family protein [Blastocatellia bacterium]